MIDMDNDYPSFFYRAGIAFALVLSTACTNNMAIRTGKPDADVAIATQTVASKDHIESESARLNQWFADKYAEELAWSPTTLTSLGSREKYDQIDDFSEKAADDFLRWQADTVAELKASFARHVLVRILFRGFCVYVLIAIVDLEMQGHVGAVPILGSAKTSRRPSV